MSARLDMSSPPRMAKRLTSFTYADNKPYLVSEKAIESSFKVLKDLDDSTKENVDEEEENAKPRQSTNTNTVTTNNMKSVEDIKETVEEEDEIEWSGDEAEISRDISILEQSITSKREHSPTKSPRKKKPC